MQSTLRFFADEHKNFHLSLTSASHRVTSTLEASSLLSTHYPIASILFAPQSYMRSLHLIAPLCNRISGRKSQSSALFPLPSLSQAVGKSHSGPCHQVDPLLLNNRLSLLRYVNQSSTSGFLVNSRLATNSGNLISIHRLVRAIFADSLCESGSRNVERRATLYLTSTELLRTRIVWPRKSGKGETGFCTLFGQVISRKWGCV